MSVCLSVLDGHQMDREAIIARSQQLNDPTLSFLLTVDVSLSYSQAHVTSQKLHVPERAAHRRNLSSRTGYKSTSDRNGSSILEAELAV